MTGRPTAPNLTDRTAHCVCGQSAPSEITLPRFEYLGPGSRWAQEICVCAGIESRTAVRLDRGSDHKLWLTVRPSRHAGTADTTRFGAVALRVAIRTRGCSELRGTAVSFPTTVFNRVVPPKATSAS